MKFINYNVIICHSHKLLDYSKNYIRKKQVLKNISRTWSIYIRSKILITNWLNTVMYIQRDSVI